MCIHKMGLFQKTTIARHLLHHIKRPNLNSSCVTILSGLISRSLPAERFPPQLVEHKGENLSLSYLNTPFYFYTFMEERRKRQVDEKAKGLLFSVL
jgi:hypothetical protein